jgi:hypothetical protein
MNKWGKLYMTIIIIAIVLAPVVDYFHVYEGGFAPLLYPYGIFWCGNERDCLHEVGHYVDFHKGWVHGQRRFQELVDRYYPTIPGVKDTPMTQTDLGEWGGYVEAYAIIYSWWKMGTTDLPPELEQFYIIE